jgi:hypothetical protein
VLFNERKNMANNPDNHGKSPSWQDAAPGQEWQALSDYNQDTNHEENPWLEFVRNYSGMTHMTFTDEEYAYVKYLCDIQGKSIDDEIRISLREYLDKFASQLDYGDIVRKRFRETTDEPQHTLETPEQIRSARLHQIAATPIMNFENSEEQTPVSLKVLTIRLAKMEHVTLGALAVLEQGSVLQVMRSALGEHLDELTRQPDFDELVEAHKNRLTAAAEELRRHVLATAEQED